MSNETAEFVAMQMQKSSLLPNLAAISPAGIWRTKYPQKKDERIIL
jgi:hypothetical protein